jgi:hypothetical protein
MGGILRTVVALTGSDHEGSLLTRLGHELSDLAADTDHRTHCCGAPAALSVGMSDAERLSVDRAIEQLCAEMITALLLAEQLRAELADAQAEVGQLRGGLMSNRDIGVAMGILMSQQLISRDEEFARLRSVSQHRHLKLRNIAEEVIETGCLLTDASPAAGSTSKPPAASGPYGDLA